MVTTFMGDNNHVLKQAQIQLSSCLITHLIYSARYKYVDACNFIGYRSEFLASLKAKRTLDPSFYYPIYDIISAWYRLKYADWAPQLRLPFTEDDIQKGADDSLLACYASEWSDFWYQETRCLTDEGHITRAIVRAFCFEGEPAGGEALNLSVLLLKDFYRVGGSSGQEVWVDKEYV